MINWEIAPCRELNMVDGDEWQERKKGKNGSESDNKNWINKRFYLFCFLLKKMLELTNFSAWVLDFTRVRENSHINIRIE